MPDKVIASAMDGPQTTEAGEARFLDWFNASQGFLDPRLGFAKFEGMGRGFVAREEIQEDEVLFTLPRHILLNTRTSVLPEVCARVSPQLGTDAPSSEKMKGWKDLGTGWASLILCMMWERWRTGEGRAAWGAFNSARDAPWTRAAEAHSADADAMEGVETSEGSAGEEKREQARTGERPRGEQEWGEYFDLLPTEFGTPMFWEAKDLAELEGTNVLGKVGRADADADYHNLLVPFIAAHEQIFFGTDLQGSFDERVQKHYSLQLYHQMGSRILSRSFHVKKPSAPGALEDTAVGEEDEESDSDEEEEYEDEEQEDVGDVSMVPMADFLNARFEADNARLFYKANSLEMRATRDIKQGEQIFNTYADPPNSDLLRRYGHVDEPNGNDVVEVGADVLVKAALALEGLPVEDESSAAVQMRKKELEERVEWWCEEGLDDVFVLSYLFPPSREPPFAPDPANPTPNELKGATADLPDEFIIALRLLCLSDAAFAKAQEKGKMPSARIDAIEEGSLPGLSAAALGLRAVELRLAAYPQSAESDETRLYGPAAETGLSRNVRNAMVVRLGEKRILMDVARVLRAVAQESECAKDGRNGAKKGKRAAQEEEGSRAGKKARG